MKTFKLSYTPDGQLSLVLFKGGVIYAEFYSPVNLIQTIRDWLRD